MTAPIFGTNQRADVLVNMTADGIDLRPINATGNGADDA